MPVKLRKSLESAAKKSGRSLNAEIVHRLSEPAGGLSLAQATTLVGLNVEIFDKLGEFDNSKTVLKHALASPADYAILAEQRVIMTRRLASECAEKLVAAK